MDRKISETVTLPSITQVNTDIVPVVDVSAGSGQKNKVIQIGELANILSGLGGSLDLSLITNALPDPHFVNNGAGGWGTSGGTVSYNKGIATYHGAGDFRIILRPFTATDWVITLTVEIFTNVGGNQIRMWTSSPETAYFSNPAVAGQWTTLYLTVPVIPAIVGSTIAMMTQAYDGDLIRNPKVFYNGDHDTLYKANSEFVQNQLSLSKFYIPSFEGKRLITLGDSITAQQTWQPTLVAATGMAYTSDSTYPGEGGHRPMGMGSSRIIPATNSDYGQSAGDSIYMRADDVKFYNPDVIILMGGQNDGLTAVGSYPTYDIWEPAYTGGEYPDGSPSLPSFVAAYKGVLKKLTEQNPAARIYTMTTMFNYEAEFTETQLKQYLTRRNLIKELSDMYSVVFIDNLTESGMSYYNNGIFNPAVHPTPEGGVRLGQLIARNL